MRLRDFNTPSRLQEGKREPLPVVGNGSTDLGGTYGCDNPVMMARKRVPLDFLGKLPKG